MTSQSPRIYIYKITFEEVPYYYYGVKKEKKYNEYYMGSPVTHKWCWELYTPKKQILQLFDFTDEGWLEAQEIEKRLIKPVYNTDKWCLNENCGGIMSLSQNSRGGKIGSRIANEKIKQLGIGIYSIPTEKRQMIGKKSGKISGKKNKEMGLGFFKMSFDEKSALGKRNAQKNKESKKGIFSLTPEQLSENGKKGGKKSNKKQKELGIGIYGLTIEQQRKNASKMNSQKWMCLETKYISTSGGLSRYQKARGIDKMKRIRVE